MNTREYGQKAEHMALSLIEQQGFKLLHQNYQCRFGEIDIIARQNNLVIFVEVRLRKNADFGNAAESVTLKKQRKVIITAQHYIQRYLQHDAVDYRFDVVALTSLDINQSEPDWIQGAW